MKICVFTDAVKVHTKKSAAEGYTLVPPNAPHIFQDTALKGLLSAHPEVLQKVLTISDLGPRLENFNVNIEKRGRVLLYNGSGGYGDQIMTWPVGKILWDLGFEVHVLVDPGNNPMWYNFSWVTSILTLPIPYSVFNMFDHHAIFDMVANTDELSSQMHPTDTMLRKIGVRPEQVSPASKVVRPNFTPTELKATKDILPGKIVAIYQLAAAVRQRSMTPSKSASILAHLARAFPCWHWLAIADIAVDKQYVEEVQKLEMANVECTTFVNQRELWSYANTAKIIVGPDSLMSHVAGVQGLPFIGLWANVDPVKRTCYYDNHVAIFKKEACPFAPCFANRSSWPNFCPPKVNREMCDVIDAITPSEVVDAVARITGVTPILNANEAEGSTHANFTGRPVPGSESNCPSAQVPPAELLESGCIPGLSDESWEKGVGRLPVSSQDTVQRVIKASFRGDTSRPSTETSSGTSQS